MSENQWMPLPEAGVGGVPVRVRAGKTLAGHPVAAPHGPSPHSPHLPLAATNGQRLLGDRLQRARDRGFVGRAAEIDLFRTALDPATRTFCTLYLYGHCGVGKTTLLRRLAEEAAHAGYGVVQIDGRAVDPSPAGFEAAALQAFGERQVLLVDVFEQCQGLEDWLREDFLGRLPDGTVVVIASLREPDVRWRTDPAWTGALRVVQLGDFARDEAAVLMDSRGVPTELHDSLFTFTRGHPFALTLASWVATQNARNMAWRRPYDPVRKRLLDEIVGDVPSPAHRQALEVCAHALNTTESVLRTFLDDDAEAGFAWLWEQPFIESGPHGLYPQDLVRELLSTDLRWRDPNRWQAMRCRIHTFLADQVIQAREAAVVPALMELTYLYRDSEVTNRFLTWRGRGEIYEDTYRRDDRDALHRMARFHMSEPTVALIDQWLNRRPQAFFVYRRSDTHQPVAFLALLKWTAQHPDSIADGVMAAACGHTERVAPLQPGEHATVARFIAQEGGPPMPSPALDLINLRLLASACLDGDSAWSFITVQNPEVWEPLLDHIGYRRIAGAAEALYAHEWRGAPVAVRLNRLSERLLHVPGTYRPAAEDEDQGTLSREDFDTAVRAALRTFPNWYALARNPLMRTRLAGQGEVDERVETLREAIIDAVDSLRGQRRRLSNSHRVLAATFFHPEATRAATAARLGLPFGTYRGYLAVGTEHVVDELWRRETGTRGGAVQADPHPAAGGPRPSGAGTTACGSHT
ncbi:ATP-binding protein [Nonomuraea lactucae]|uniref:ATP-binding protein n=1 Tax=Nonomuraea lactucae TaxID=2249762 RepID=UPI000DE46F54|nr:ATP-binding protein [Nonomuraea lactucae]